MCETNQLLLQIVLEKDVVGAARSPQQFRTLGTAVLDLAITNIKPDVKVTLQMFVR